MLELLHPLQDVLGAPCRRKEGIRRYRERWVETQRSREVADAPGPALEEGARVIVGTDAHDLAHGERPTSLERSVAGALMTPAFRLRCYQRRRLDHRAGESGIDMVADRRIEGCLRRRRRVLHHQRRLVMLGDATQHLLVIAQVRSECQPMRE